jgi:hypothetical protein
MPVRADMTLHAVCGMVILQVKDGKMAYQLDEAALVAGGVVRVSVPGEPRSDLIGYKYRTKILVLFPGPETHLREYSGRIARVTDTDCLQIRLDIESDVDCCSRTGGQDQAVLKGR